MAIEFTKKIPDELWVDNFSKGLTATYVYDGPDKVYVIVDNENGQHVGLTVDKDYHEYNENQFDKLEIDATVDTDIAYYLTTLTNPVTREYNEVKLVNGETYQEVSNPRIQDYYTIKYDIENKVWVWNLLTKEPKSIINKVIEEYRNKVNSELKRMGSNANSSVTKAASNYLKVLDDYENTGNGSIQSWKRIEFDVSDVPTAPLDLMTAFNTVKSAKA